MKIKKVIALMMSFVLSFTVTGLAVEAKTTQEHLNEVKELKEKIQNEYMGETLTEEELFEAALRGMTLLLDDYSVIFNEYEIYEFLNRVNNEEAGLGMSFEVSNQSLVVRRVFDGSSAAENDVRIGDQLVKVENSEVEQIGFFDALEQMGGEVGTQIKLTFKRQTEILVKTLTIKEFERPTIFEMNLNDYNGTISDKLKQKTTAIEISTFGEETDKELEKVISKAKKEGKQYLLIDIRSNSGGYMDTAIDMCKQLIPAGNITQVVNKKGEKRVYRSTLSQAPFKIVLLVDENSASASEMMAAAIKESKVGVLVGQTTYGKGVVQNLTPLGDAYVLKLTIEEFFSPQGNPIHYQGVTPDIVVPNQELLYGERRLFAGDKGEDVLVLEQALTLLGYFSEPADEKYDAVTYRAVMKFQADVGLYAYGVCDYTTQDKINERILEKLFAQDDQFQAAIDWIEKDMK